MTKLPTIRTKYGEGVGIELFIQSPDIASNEKTFTSADEASGQTVLSVVSSANFATDQYILIGSFGDETAEIRKVSSTASGTVTISSATTFAHPRGTRITFIPYNQIVVERQAGGSGSFSALSAVAIRADATETYIQRVSDSSTDVYKYRFYNETSTNYSAYSDTATASGYADNSVHSIKRRALQQLGEKIGDVITDQFLNEALWEGRRELDQDPRILRWSFRVKIDENVLSIVPGTYTMTIPTDLRDPKSNKNILSIRVGKNNRALDYQDISRFNENYYGVAHTTLNGAVLTADTSITLTDSGDFEESGSIDIAAGTVAGTVDSVAYTANTETTNVLSGVTGIQSAGHATGTDVWQGVTFGEPRAFTVDGDSGVIKFDVPFEDNLAGENVYMDYYSTMTAVNSDADTLDEPEYDLFISYLKWKVKYLKSNGKLRPQEDGDYIEWVKRKDDLITKQYLGQKLHLIPDTDA